MADLEIFLQKFGLSDKEARLYLTMLSKGPDLVSDIAKVAGINRSTTYVLLENLAMRGLVSSFEEGGVKKFSAAPPERLVDYVEEQAKKYSSLVGVANNLLPQLKNEFAGAGPKPKIQYYEGVEGLKSAYEDTLTSSETIRAYASIGDMHSVLGDYFPEYYQRRAEKGIHIRAIFPDTPEAKERIKHNRQEARDARLVPKEEYGFTPEINMYDNKVVFMSLQEKFALIIESHELADALKKAFELAWKEAKNLNKK
ncbi:MAG: helix-turn-helix domain-containing protein [Patescibacteria group bacterium]